MWNRHSKDVGIFQSFNLFPHLTTLENLNIRSNESIENKEIRWNELFKDFIG